MRGLILVGSDPVRDMPDSSIVRDGLDAAEYVIAIDLFLNDSNRIADLVLPAAAFAEKAGTATNVEGRVQKLNQVVPPAGQARADWAILDDIASQALTSTSSTYDPAQFSTLTDENGDDGAGNDEALDHDR